MQPGCIETLKQIVFVSTIESGSDNFKIGDTYLLLPINLFLGGCQQEQYLFTGSVYTSGHRHKDLHPKPILTYNSKVLLAFQFLDTQH